MLFRSTRNRAAISTSPRGRGEAVRFNPVQQPASGFAHPAGLLGALAPRPSGRRCCAATFRTAKQCDRTSAFLVADSNLWTRGFGGGFNHLARFKCGAPGRIRTCDRRLRRPLLYPAELRALRSFVDSPPSENRHSRVGGNPAPLQPLGAANTIVGQNGRGDRIRTCDLLLPKQSRYQPALRPEGITYYVPLLRLL